LEWVCWVFPSNPLPATFPFSVCFVPAEGFYDGLMADPVRDFTYHLKIIPDLPAAFPSYFFHIFAAISHFTGLLSKGLV
jgi:hypothetical protein